MSNYVPLFYVDLITYPCPNPDVGLANFVSKLLSCQASKAKRGCFLWSKSVYQTIHCNWSLRIHMASSGVSNGRVTHICVGKLTVIASDNGLSPERRQAIIWTNAGILLIGPLGTNFSEISIEIQTFLFKKMHLKISSAKWRPFCLGLYVLIGAPGLNVYTIQNTAHYRIYQLRFICKGY